MASSTHTHTHARTHAHTRTHKAYNLCYSTLVSREEKARLQPEEYIVTPSNECFVKPSVRPDEQGRSGGVRGSGVDDCSVCLSVRLIDWLSSAAYHQPVGAHTGACLA